LFRDPTSSESYIALRNALVAIQSDSSAILSILSSLSDSGKGWVETAYHDLRQCLVQGRLQEAESQGKLIGVVLDVQEQGSRDEFAENRLHRESMQWLLDGIGAILAQDNLTGMKHLEQLTEAVYCNESLQWVAWLWMARAATDEGNLPRARDSARAALERARSLDPQARGNTLCSIAEIEFLGEEVPQALEHLSSAIATFEEIGDQRGMATASLSLARMLVRLDREGEGIEAAHRARRADPDWDEPAIFLSQRVLLKGQLAEAKSQLTAFDDQRSLSPDIRRQERLIEYVRTGVISITLAGESLRIKDRPPSKDELGSLRKLWIEQPRFVEVRELLAWNLVKLGEEEEASQHFEDMSEQCLEPEIHASVLLGLGCLANRRFGHRQSAARVRAAADASPPILRPPEKPKGAPPRPPAPRGPGTIQTRGPENEGTKTQQLPAARPDTKPMRSDELLEQSAMVMELEAEHLEAELDRVEMVRPSHGTGGANPAVSSSGPKAVFTGDLQLFAVPDLLEFMKSSRRTGTLVITSEGGIGAVHLRQGMVTGAASPQCTNIGDRLLQSGALSEAQLKQAAAFQQQNCPDRLLGSILVEQGLVDPTSLKKTLVEQIKGAIFEMVGWQSGRFAFEPDKRNQVDRDVEIDIELDTQELLLDVLRVFDEQNR
jgi:tetratricopeptide (TPR) repeat protein